MLLKERGQSNTSEIETTSRSCAIQVLVDLVSTGEDAEELSVYVWESLCSPQSPTSVDNAPSPDHKTLAKRKLSNKVSEVYENIFHGPKVEIDKEGFLVNAFRPVYTGNKYLSN